MAVAAALRAWSGVNPDSIARSWGRISAGLIPVVTAAQQAAAASADPFVEAALAAQRVARSPEGQVVAEQFAGVASDGRPLATLLTRPAVSTLQLIAGGTRLDVALRSGGHHIAMIVATQVSDAGRVADGVAIATRPGVAYVRQLSTPSCSRCAVLAGRVYRFNSGFSRHPRCDCTHIPVAENVRGDVTTDPKAYFASLSRADQDRIFTNDGAEAIRRGADIGQVVNARRGMTAAGTTTEGTTRRGNAGRRLRGQQRLMPEAIFARAGTDRGLAVELLRDHGFIV